MKKLICEKIIPVVAYAGMFLMFESLFLLSIWGYYM